MSLFKIYNYLFLLLCLVIPFEEKFKVVPNIIMAFLGVLFFFVTNKQQVKELFVKYSFKFLCALIVFISLSSIFSNTFFDDFFFIRKLLIPFVFVLLSIPIKNFTVVAISFVSSTALAVILSLLNIVSYVMTTSGFQFSRGEFINDVLVSERLYLGFCCAISFVLLIHLFYGFKTKRQRFFVILASMVMMTFVLLIAARIAIITFLVISLIHIFTKQSTKKIVIYGGLLAILVLFFFMFNKNLGFRFLRNTDTHRKSFIEKIVTHEPRVDVWKCSYQIFKYDSNVIFGNGFRKVRQQLLNCYQNTIDIGHRKNWFVKVNFNTHNQYLDFLLGSGIFGLILFCTTLFFLFYESRRNMFQLYMFIALLLMMLVENIFQRQIGSYLFSLIMLLVYLSDRDGNSKLSELKR